MISHDLRNQFFCVGETAKAQIAVHIPCLCGKSCDRYMLNEIEFERSYTKQVLLEFGPPEREPLSTEENRMIVRLTQKLGKKIHVSPTKSYPLDSNPLADWSAHLFTVSRTQYILVTNTASLYSAVLYGRGISDDMRFLDSILSTVREVMEDDGLSLAYQKLVAPSSATVVFSKAFSRSVTGSMNDHIMASKLFLGEVELSPHETSFKLNCTPLSAIKYGNPRKAIQALCADLM